MSVIRRPFIVLLLTTCLVSCLDSQSKTEGSLNVTEDCGCKADHPVVDYELIERYHIPVADIAYHYEISSVFVGREGTVEYWGFDDFSSAFYRFDVEQEVLIEKIPIPDKGPDNLSPIKDFLPVSPDSIFLHYNEHRLLRLIDRQANKLAEWSFKRDLPSGRPAELYYFLTIPYGYTRLTYIEEKRAMLYHPLYYIEGATLPYPKGHYELPCFLTFQLDENRYGDLYGAYPASYQQDDYSSYEMFLPFCYVAPYTIASFQKSHCLYWLGENAVTKKTCARSHYLPERFTFLPMGSAPDMWVRTYKTIGNYVAVLPDTTRGVLYRLVAHAQDPPVDINGVVKEKLRSTWSIMVIDMDTGECLGEARFPREMYNFFDVWVVPEGVLISEENPYRTDNEEDKLSFSLVRLKY